MTIRTHIPNFWSTLLFANAERSKLWGGDKLDLGFKFIELIGELGEWSNQVKKLERERLGVEGSRTTKEAMLLELGDFLVTQAIIFNKLGIKKEDIDQAVALAFNNKSFELGFSIYINAGGAVESTYDQAAISGGTE